MRVKRPKVPDHPSTVGLNEKELVKLLEAAKVDGLHSAALMTLLALNGLRIGEPCPGTSSTSAMTSGTGSSSSRRGNKRSTEALAPATAAARAPEAYIGERTTGPIFLDHNGRV